MLEELNTVVGLTREIERLRAGEDQVPPTECTKLTAGQMWHRLLDMPVEARIELLTSLLKSADRGFACEAHMHRENLDDLRAHAALIAGRGQQWLTAQRLLGSYIQGLLQTPEREIASREVADRLRVFLGTGEEKIDGRGRPVICGHSWVEADCTFQCVEPVGPGGEHHGEHHAYMRKGSTAGAGLRVRYLEEENEALREQLGLLRNRRSRSSATREGS